MGLKYKAACGIFDSLFKCTNLAIKGKDVDACRSNVAYACYGRRPTKHLQTIGMRGSDNSNARCC